MSYTETTASIINRLQKRVEELEAERLKTVDGVPVKNGQHVYFWDSVNKRVGDCALVFGGFEPELVDPECNGWAPGQFVDLSLCYSSHEAAAASREERDTK